MIHDFELASFGGTNENVAHWLAAGQYGLWRQTGALNDLAVQAAASGHGLGEILGQWIEERRPPHAALSLAAAGFRARVPMTVHVGIGQDIVHCHPNFDGAAWGKASDTDFLIFARTVQELSGGVFEHRHGGHRTGGFLESPLDGPQCARQRGQSVHGFTTAVFDLVELPDDCGGAAGQGTSALLFRAVEDDPLGAVIEGGSSYYFQGDHRQTLPTLWHKLTAK